MCFPTKSVLTSQMKRVPWLPDVQFTCLTWPHIANNYPNEYLGQSNPTYDMYTNLLKSIINCDHLQYFYNENYNHVFVLFCFFVFALFLLPCTWTGGGEKNKTKQNKKHTETTTSPFHSQLLMPVFMQ